MSEEKKQISTFAKILLKTYFFSTPILVIMIIQKMLVNEDLKIIIKDYLPIKWDFESKILLLSTVSIIMSIFILFFITIIKLTRISLLAHPMGKNQPTIVIFLNRILRNSLEQFLSFFPLLVYWSYNICKEENKHQVLIFGIIWLMGRIFYVIGYSMHFISKEFAVYRAFGFFMTHIGSICLALRIANIHYI